MFSFFYQAIIPFLFSCIIVIFITVIAERFGTKTGGIIGTLPSTIVVAFIFIAFNKDVFFASRTAIVVPAEMGVNAIFLCVFSMYANRSLYTALTISLGVWILLSGLLFIYNVENIAISIMLYAIMLTSSFIILEKYKKIRSSERVSVHYTPLKLLLRGLFAGVIIATAVLLTNVGETASGILSVFPAIFLSAMLIFIREHGPVFTGGMSKSMSIGTMSVTSYAIGVHFLYPHLGIGIGTFFSYLIAFTITMVLFAFRKRIS